MPFKFLVNLKTHLCSSKDKSLFYPKITSLCNPKQYQKTQSELLNICYLCVLYFDKYNRKNSEKNCSCTDILIQLDTDFNPK